MSASDFPNTILLTAWAPDARYAGAEAMRRVLSMLPQERLRWVSLAAPQGPVSRGLPETKAFPSPAVHWRLRGSLAEAMLLYEAAPLRLARQIVEWADEKGFSAGLVWVLPELAAINTGYHVARLLGLPVHATIYDTLESAGYLGLSRLYYPLYMARVRRFFAHVRSFDTVSLGLRAHVRNTYLGLRDGSVRQASVARHVPDCVLPSSVPVAWMRHEGSLAGHRWIGSLRKIAFCGAMRVSLTQWQTFLGHLGSLPYTFEFDAYAWGDSIPRTAYPGNVTVKVPPYIEREEELVRRLQEGGYDACYLPLWREAERQLFGKTSLSSKLTTYAAAGLPVIVDGPEESVAGALVRQFGAGVAAEGDGDSRASLNRLFSDHEYWRGLSTGSVRLCHEVFHLEQNVSILRDVLCGTAGSARAEMRDSSRRGQNAKQEDRSC